MPTTQQLAPPGPLPSSAGESSAADGSRGATASRGRSDRTAAPDAFASSPAGDDRTDAPRPLPLRCRHCGATRDAAPVAICDDCLAPLEPDYDPRRTLPGREAFAARPASLWRYREWLPFVGAPTLSLDTGFTPLVDSPALARALGVARALVKNDSVSHPSLSFKDRVVATAINAAVAFRQVVFACASTGNLANAAAAQAARAGLPAWVFIPHDLEVAKVVGTLIYGARVVRVSGTYDDVNRLCAQLADHYGWGFANVNLRAYYGEGSKTVAFEIVEQLGWRLPSAVVAPMAGGSLVTKLRTGFSECRDAGLADGALPRLFGAQADGCAPIARLIESGADHIVPEAPRTIARSIAIGNPADGRTAAAALRETGGWAAAVSDEALVAGIRLLAETTGIFTETAGGATVAAALELSRAGRLGPRDEVVLCITGNGLKTIDAAAAAITTPPVIAARLRAVEALVDDAAPAGPGRG